MMLEVGKLYSCSGYFLLIYPDLVFAVVGHRPSSPAWDADLDAAYWSKRFGKPVSYCDPETPLLVLSVNDKYHEVLAGDQKGWIINEEWLELKEIVNEAA